MTAQEYRVLNQSERKIYIKVTILNSDFNIIDELVGLAISGTYTIDENSAIRRTSNVTFLCTDRLIPSPTSPFWVNKRYKLFVGIEDILTGEIVWFRLGVYCVSNPSINISVSGKTINISGLDLMALSTGDIAGQLEANYIIEEDTPIHDAIRKTYDDLSFEKRLNIGKSEYNVPYQIEHNVGSSVWDILEELTCLYMRYETYYDLEGFAVFRKKMILLSDPIEWDFSENNLLLEPISSTFNDKNVKNHIYVYGKILDDKTQPSCEIVVDNAHYPDCPFTIEKLGEPFHRQLVITENNYTETEQCVLRCEYEVAQHTNMAETIQFTCVPIYTLDVGQLVSFNRPEDGIVGKYAVTNISCGLGHDATMSVSAYKVYNDATLEI